MKGADMVEDCPYTQSVKFGTVALVSPWMSGAAMAESFANCIVLV